MRMRLYIHVCEESNAAAVDSLMIGLPRRLSEQVELRGQAQLVNERRPTQRPIRLHVLGHMNHPVLGGGIHDAIDEVDRSLGIGPHDGTLSLADESPEGH